MKAQVVYTDPFDGSELIEVTAEVRTHRLQYGGGQGDGYCYAHQSFACIDHLTASEQLAIDNAEVQQPDDERR